MFQQNLEHAISFVLMASHYPAISFHVEIWGNKGRWEWRESAVAAEGLESSEAP